MTRRSSSWTQVTAKALLGSGGKTMEMKLSRTGYVVLALLGKGA
jgi:hypothetical protein